MDAQVGHILGSFAKLALGVGGAVALARLSLYTVDGGERAVVFNRFKGVESKIRGEGLHVRVPWVQMPYVLDVRTRPRSISSVTGTRDLQMVNLTLRVLSRPDKNELPTIYKTLGTDYDERVLPSIGNEVLKAVVAQYNADQLLTQREKISRQIKDALTARAQDFNIVLEDVSITHLTFGREFAQAIEMKQVAHQEAERSKFVVMKAQQEQRAAVIRAEGESESARLVSSALKTGPALIELRRIEAAREIAHVLANSPNVTWLPTSGPSNGKTGSGILLNLPAGGGK